MRIIPTPGFEKPPYHVEAFKYGFHAVCNREGFNCLHFLDKPGAIFTTKERADAICEEWNRS